MTSKPNHGHALFVCYDYITILAYFQAVINIFLIYLPWIMPFLRRDLSSIQPRIRSAHILIHLSYMFDVYVLINIVNTSPNGLWDKLVTTGAIG